MKTAIITQANEHQISIDTPYDRDWLDAFRLAIHYTNRKWGGKGTGWLVDDGVADEAIRITAQHFEIQDRRGRSEAEVVEMQDAAEDAALEGEIAQIQSHQAYIREHETQIDHIISELDSVIGRYSYRSQSSIKAGLARDRALLWHSQRNAQLPVEQLTELHVRGLAAAVRLLEQGQISARGYVIRW